METGIPDVWVNDTAGVTVQNLPAYCGRVSFAMRKKADEEIVDLAGNLAVQKGKIIVKVPFALTLASMTVDGNKFAGARDTLAEHPPRVLFTY